MSAPNTNFNLLSFIAADLTRHPVRVLLFLALLVSAGLVILTKLKRDDAQVNIWLVS